MVWIGYVWMENCSGQLWLGKVTYSLGKVVNLVRIKESMCSCFSAYNLVIALSLILWLVYHIFPTTCWVPTISVLNLVIFPMLLKPAAQKLKKIWDSSMMSSRWAITPGRLPVELWSFSAAISWRVIRFSLLQDIIHVINILYWDICYFVSIFCMIRV
jgi:hypothetical protein